jgi:hypothetical protein
MHWPSVLASANPLRERQRFVRPSRKDAGRHLCGCRDGVFEVSRAKPGAQLEAFIAETEHTATGSAPKWTDASSKVVSSGMVLFLSCVALWLA